MKKQPEMMKNADRFVHAIFCDDMRQEVGNKVSFMGCYQGELFVAFVPMMLPRLCVYVTVSSAVQRPLKALSVRLDQGANQLAVIEMTSDDLARAVPPATGDATRLAANVGVMLSPFAITEPGEIHVVVVTEEGEMPGPRLHIKVMPQTDATVAPAEPLAPVKAALALKKIAARSAPTKKAK